METLPNFTLPINTSDSDTHKNDIYHQARSYLCEVLYPIIIVVGVTTNSLALIIMRQWSLARNPIYLCLTALSYTNITMLLFSAGHFWIRFAFHLDLTLTYNWYCTAHRFLEYFLSNLNIWIVVLITVQRCVVIYYPMHANSFCTIRRTRLGLFILTLLVALKDVSVLWHASITTLDHGPICQVIHNFRFWTVFSWSEIFCKLLLPYPIIVTLNYAIYRQIRLANRRRLSMFSSIGGTNAGKTNYNSRRRPVYVRHSSAPQLASFSTTAQSTQGLHLEEAATTTALPELKTVNETQRIFPLLVTLNIAFLFCYAPLGIFMVCESVFHFFILSNTYNYHFYGLVFQGCLTLLYLNHATNFFLFIASGKHFRYHMFSLFAEASCCRGHQIRRGYAARRRNTHSQQLFRPSLPSINAGSSFLGNNNESATKATSKSLNSTFRKNSLCQAWVYKLNNSNIEPTVVDYNYTNNNNNNNRETENVSISPLKRRRSDVTNMRKVATYEKPKNLFLESHTPATGGPIPLPPNNAGLDIEQFWNVRQHLHCVPRIKKLSCSHAASAAAAGGDKNQVRMLARSQSATHLVKY